MSDAQPDLARALGAAAGVGLLAMVTGRAKPPLGSVAAGAAAVLTLSQRRADDTCDPPPSP